MLKFTDPAVEQPQTTHPTVKQTVKVTTVYTTLQSVWGPEGMDPSHAQRPPPSGEIRVGLGSEEVGLHRSQACRLPLAAQSLIGLRKAHQNVLRETHHVVPKTNTHNDRSKIGPTIQPLNYVALDPQTNFIIVDI